MTIKAGVCAIFLCGIVCVATAAPLPRVMVLMSEKNLGTYSVSEAERVITEALLNRGVEVIDADMVRTSVNRDKLLHASTGGPAVAAALGLQFGAEIVIVGEALAKGSATTIANSAMRSYSATITLKAVNTATSSIINTKMNTTARPHVDDVAGGTLAIQTAAKEIMPDFLDDLLGRYATPADVANNVRLLVSNVNQIWQLTAIKDILRGQRQAEEVVQRGYVTGVAEFDVHWRGDPAILAEELTLANPGYFRIKVLGISPGKLDAQLVVTGG
jgi:hypothetical protein